MPWLGLALARHCLGLPLLMRSPTHRSAACGPAWAWTPGGIVKKGLEFILSFVYD